MKGYIVTGITLYITSHRVRDVVSNCQVMAHERLIDATNRVEAGRGLFTLDLLWLRGCDCQQHASLWHCQHHTLHRLLQVCTVRNAAATVWWVGCAHRTLSSQETIVLKTLDLRHDSCFSGWQLHYFIPVTLSFPECIHACYTDRSGPSISVI